MARAGHRRRHRSGSRRAHAHLVGHRRPRGPAHRGVRPPDRRTAVRAAAVPRRYLVSAPAPVTARRPAAEVRERVGALPDPELPVIGLGDLGVVGRVAPGADGVLEVEITPTYLGCPALPEITAAVREVLADCGHPDGRVRQVLTPPWTTDRITPEGRRRLAAHGIAPPVSPAPAGPVPVEPVAVP